VSIPEARRIQEELRGLAEPRDRLGAVELVAGADVSYDRKAPHLFAAVVLWDVKRRDVVEIAGARAPACFPYVPGYLSFREVPAILRAFASLHSAPQLIVADGHGWAHPRRFGLACHLGVLLDVPTIGCAKSRLVGTHREPGTRRGARSRLLDQGDCIGEVVRTRTGFKPIFASIGHRVSLATARRWILRLTPRYRLPEPIRAAHREVNRLRREAGGAR